MRPGEIYALWNISKKYFSGGGGPVRAIYPAAAPPMADSNLFAIGDVHGCFDELESLVMACDSIGDAENSRFVFVGDYIDRGPDPAKVVEFLIDRQLREKDRYICLRGNHEDMLLNAAREDRTDRDLMNWWGNGGEQTLDSYGVDDPAALPPDHLAWIKALPLKFADPLRLYVHAGVRPGISIAAQAEKDLLWIREPFLSSAEDHGAFIIHGHTPTRSRLPDLRANRLNIDTGACFGGPLTAALFTVDRVLPKLFLNSDGKMWQPNPSFPSQTS
jgi:serine/threonine protein phosphatase 1